MAVASGGHVKGVGGGAVGSDLNHLGRTCELRDDDGGGDRGCQLRPPRELGGDATSQAQRDARLSNERLPIAVIVHLGGTAQPTADVGADKNARHAQ